MSGIIYKLSIGEHWYIGSTTETLSTRLSNHRTAYKRQVTSEKTYKVYDFILKNGGWDSVVATTIENEIKEEVLHLREQEHIDISNPLCLNSYNVVAPLVPARVPVYARGEKKRETDKAYYEANKERLKKLRMERYKKDKEDPERYARIKETTRNAVVRLKRKMAESSSTIAEKPMGGAGL